MWHSIYFYGLAYTFIVVAAGVMDDDDELEDYVLSIVERVVLSAIVAIGWPFYWGVLMYQTFRGK